MPRKKWSEIRAKAAPSTLAAAEQMVTAVDGPGDCSITIETQTADRWREVATIIVPILAPGSAA